MIFLLPSTGVLLPRWLIFESIFFRKNANIWRPVYVDTLWTSYVTGVIFKSKSGGMSSDPSDKHGKPPRPKAITTPKPTLSTPLRLIDKVNESSRKVKSHDLTQRSSTAIGTASARDFVVGRAPDAPVVTTQLRALLASHEHDALLQHRYITRWR